MAKQSRPSQAKLFQTRLAEVLKEAGLEYTDDGPVVVTATGARWLCHPVAAALDDLSNRLETDEPHPPTYALADVAGVSRTYDWTQKLIDDIGTDEDKETWASYLAEKEAWDDQVAEARVRFIAVRGGEWLNPPADDAWIEEDEFIGLKVPEPGPSRAHYVFTSRVIGTQTDAERMVKGIYIASANDMSTLENVGEIFRRQMERAQTPNALPDPASNGGQETAGLVCRDVVDDDAGSAGDEPS